MLQYTVTLAKEKDATIYTSRGITYICSEVCAKGLLSTLTVCSLKSDKEELVMERICNRMPKYFIQIQTTNINCKYNQNELMQNSDIVLNAITKVATEKLMKTHRYARIVSEHF